MKAYLKRCSGIDPAGPSAATQHVTPTVTANPLRVRTHSYESRMVARTRRTHGPPWTASGDDYGSKRGAPRGRGRRLSKVLTRPKYSAPSRSRLKRKAGIIKPVFAKCQL